MASASAMDSQAARADGKTTGKRRESKEFRREQLINATIDSLAKRGYAATTLADVADGAGLSRGIVNFHFDSKEKLLIETLQSMSDEYGRHWREALAGAGGQAAQQLRMLIRADLDKKICNSRLISAWAAFWAEAKTRPSYQKLCWDRDDDYLGEIRRVCTALKEEGNYAFDPKNVAVAIYCMQEGLWLRLMLGGREFKREGAVAAAMELLGSLFPLHFENDGSLKKKGKTGGD
ncbi:MAG: TetR family transcriptional regulator C-terminal domain-containing protein [Rhizobiaceae bacterium]